ncbi:hypothetical protein PIB30_058873 [Stylosanthes scabra]|uniref:Uncharacterized protein n=1 Tax=Stylosanthes scabra TaxID=79078 RepID=A0ABU6UIV6_9FABA|nr:hypothetical protein [Stylosanthes scabra]
MDEIKNPQEPATFPSKRKPDDPIPQQPLIKAPKLSSFDHHNNNNNSNDHVTASEPLAENDKSETDVVLGKEAANGDTKLRNDVVDNDEEHAGEEEEDDDDDEDDEDDDDDEEEEDNAEAEVDRKGKGVLRDDKGKGKLIVEEDDDDDDGDSDDDSDVDGFSGDESDFSDDPLAEVDLNNILPSRTRRRTFQPGLHIPSKPVNFAADDDDDDDDSDA